MVEHLSSKYKALGSMCHSADDDDDDGVGDDKPNYKTDFRVYLLSLRMSNQST